MVAVVEGKDYGIKLSEEIMAKIVENIDPYFKKSTNRRQD